MTPLVIAALAIVAAIVFVVGGIVGWVLACAMVITDKADAYLHSPERSTQADALQW